jgi:hypothetical protein
MNYVVKWGDGFIRSLIRLGLTWKQWEELGGRDGIEGFLGINPYEEDGTQEMPDTGGTRFVPTKDKAPDLPELLIAYDVDPIHRTVTVLGANRSWGADALQRP